MMMNISIFSILLAIISTKFCVIFAASCYGVYCGTSQCNSASGTCSCQSPSFGPNCLQLPTYSCSNLAPFGVFTISDTFPSGSYKIAAQMNCPPNFGPYIRYVNAQSQDGHSFNYMLTPGFGPLFNPSTCVYLNGGLGGINVAGNQLGFKCASASSCNIKFEVSIDCRPLPSTNRNVCSLSPQHCPRATNIYSAINSTNVFIQPCCDDGTNPNFDPVTGSCSCGLQCPNSCYQGALPSHGNCNGNTGICECLPGYSGIDCGTKMSSSSSTAASSPVVLSSSSSSAVAANTPIPIDGTCVCSCCNGIGCTSTLIGSFRMNSISCTTAACSAVFTSQCPSGSNGVVSATFTSTPNYATLKMYCSKVISLLLIMSISFIMN